jgi:endonuclease/exonuclease/phosphatase family metal-dependent hydrolase
MKLKVISFNIRCCDDNGGNSVAERAPRLATVTEPYGADVIGVQEYTPIWEKPLEEYFGDKYEIFNKYRCTEGHIESAPLLWMRDKFECIKKGYFWLSDTPEVESRGWDERFNCYRMCVYAVLKEKQSGTSFVFMNTHFGFGDNGQVRSADLIHTYRQKLSEYPAFVVGDFNMTPTSPGYAAMSRHFTDVNAATAHDLRSTYHGYDLTVPRDQHIDYCFIDKPFVPLDQRIITDTVDGKFPSDHFGLHITLRLPE